MNLSPEAIRIGKVVVAIVWIVTAAAFFCPVDSKLVEAGRLTFFATLGAHVLECAVFFTTVRASGKPIGPELAQVLLFGVFHFASLKAEMDKEAWETL